jgi:hypothetical protein
VDGGDNDKLSFDPDMMNLMTEIELDDARLVTEVAGAELSALGCHDDNECTEKNHLELLLEAKVAAAVQLEAIVSAQKAELSESKAETLAVFQRMGREKEIALAEVEEARTPP